MEAAQADEEDPSDEKEEEDPEEMQGESGVESGPGAP
jgi:hypothetical protein